MHFSLVCKMYGVNAVLEHIPKEAIPPQSGEGDMPDLRSLAANMSSADFSRQHGLG